MEVVNMETVTDYFGRERLELEVSSEVLEGVLEAAALLAAGGLRSRNELVISAVRERYGVASTSRLGALRELVALVRHLVRALDTVDPASGVAGVSLLVPLEGGWQAFGGVDVYPRDLEGQS